MCRVSRNSGALTYQKPKRPLGLSGITLPFIIVIVGTSPCKISIILVRFLRNINFFREIFWKTLKCEISRKSHLWKSNCSMRRVRRVERQKGKDDKANSRFSQFCELAWKPKRKTVLIKFLGLLYHLKTRNVGIGTNADLAFWKLNFFRQWKRLMRLNKIKSRSIKEPVTNIFSLRKNRQK